MNKYQAKLEAIKSKRLSTKERFQSLLIFISMVFMSLLVLPFFAFSWVWSIYESMLTAFPYESMAYISAGVGILLGLFVIFLIFYCMGIGLKHLTLFLSGIKEGT